MTMAEQLSTPRITAAYLDNFVGRVVMLVGEVTQLRGDQATLESDGTVTVLLNRDAHLSNGNTVQVIGKVNPDLSIKVLTSRDLGNTVDHGPFQSSQPYAPRVAMIWTSPKRSDAYRSATHQRQAYFDEKNRKSNVTTPKSDSTDTTTSRPLHNNTHTAAQRLQSRTRSNYGQSRPSISMSFTTYSSDIRGREIESRSISPPYPSHISQTLLLTPSIGSLLPSPPEEITICRSYSPETTGPSFIETPSGTYSSSQQTYDQDSQLSHIPSAQPYGYTPLGYSPPPMSSPSLLPSPPMTQSTEEGFRSYQPPMSPTFSASSRRYSSLTGRRLPDDSAISDSRLDDLPESELFDSVLEGIGRIHVSMGRDDAGRWRIQRATDERP
ncbi:replication factor A protein 3-domain-containing protein [Fusarium venenatum]|uniref:replication factor A protein 3-domain-containing protein n=1 Tax=Fusarium venenatum TaxID=56646 RepID=UPI001E0B3599|nr:replication factor A protein 3-domain-containing protein [Fusarium venenatum]